MLSKDEIRAQIKARRKEAAASDAKRLAAGSAEICRKIEAMEGFRNAGTILSYVPMKGEVDVSLLDCSGKKVILADCDWKDIPAGEIDFAVIPGVAFAPAASGWKRMGRGGGYYDRLIPLMHCPTVAPAFAFQIFEDIPCEEWDRPVDAVVTTD